MRTAGKRSIGEVAFSVTNYILLSALIILCIYPFWHIFIYSISDPVLANLGIKFIPKGFTFFNYHQVFMIKGIHSATFISVARTVIGMTSTVFSCSLLAYLFTKKEMPARSFLYRAVVITMYISGGLIPYFLLCKAYGLINNFLVYILPSMVSAYYIILIKTFIEQLPDSLEESAKLDGAGYLVIFIRIIFPLSLPIIATIAVFAAVGQWNSWFDNYIFAGSSDQLRTLQLMLYNTLNQADNVAKLIQSQSIHGNSGAIVNQMQLTPNGVRMTITMVATLPILVVYLFMQRFFVKGIMLGAIKG